MEKPVAPAPGKPARGTDRPGQSAVVWKSKGNDMTELNDVVVLSGTRLQALEALAADLGEAVRELGLGPGSGGGRLDHPP